MFTSIAPSSFPCTAANSLVAVDMLDNCRLRLTLSHGVMKYEVEGVICQVKPTSIHLVTHPYIRQNDRNILETLGVLKDHPHTIVAQTIQITKSSPKPNPVHRSSSNYRRCPIGVKPFDKHHNLAPLRGPPHNPAVAPPARRVHLNGTARPLYLV
ncbi:hypothetical protein VTI74DRAFT_11070 [Chaetomium olivicolor]